MGRQKKQLSVFRIYTNKYRYIYVFFFSFSQSILGQEKYKN